MRDFYFWTEKLPPRKAKKCAAHRSTTTTTSRAIRVLGQRSNKKLVAVYVGLDSDGSNRLVNIYIHTIKVELIWEPALNQEFTGFPAKI